MKERRDHIVSVRLTDAERTHLGRLAETEGLTPSEFLRRAVLPPPPVQVPGVVDTTPIATGYAVVFPTPFSQGTPGIVWPDGTVGGSYTVGAA